MSGRPAPATSRGPVQTGAGQEQADLPGSPAARPATGPCSRSLHPGPPSRTGKPWAGLRGVQCSKDRHGHSTWAPSTVKKSRGFLLDVVIGRTSYRDPAGETAKRQAGLGQGQSWPRWSWLPKWASQSLRAWDRSGDTSVPDKADGVGGHRTPLWLERGWEDRHCLQDLRTPQSVPTQGRGEGETPFLSSTVLRAQGNLVSG